MTSVTPSLTLPRKTRFPSASGRRTASGWQPAKFRSGSFCASGAGGQAGRVSGSFCIFGAGARGISFSLSLPIGRDKLKLMPPGESRVRSAYFAQTGRWRESRVRFAHSAQTGRRGGSRVRFAQSRTQAGEVFRVRFATFRNSRCRESPFAAFRNSRVGESLGFVSYTPRRRAGGESPGFVLHISRRRAGRGSLGFVLYIPHRQAGGESLGPLPNWVKRPYTGQ